MSFLKVLAAVMASSLLAVSSVSAQISVGAGMGSIGIDERGFDDNVNGIALDVSGKFNKYVGYSVGAQFRGDEGPLELDHYFAAKVRGGMDIGGGFLFLSAGFGSAAWSVRSYGNIPGYDFDYNLRLLGAGYEIFFGKEKKWGAGVEFSQDSGERQTMATVRYRF